MITTEEYRVLWNALTDAIEKLDDLRNNLIEAQQKAEEIVINSEE